MVEENKLQAGPTSKIVGILGVATGVLAVLLLSVVLSLTGCSQSSDSSKESETNYTVVNINAGTNPKDYFDFTVVDHVAVNTDVAPDLNISDGVYSIGRLNDGNTVVWLSDSETTFVYIEDEITNASLISWAGKLKETAIPYEDFSKTL